MGGPYQLLVGVLLLGASSCAHVREDWHYAILAWCCSHGLLPMYHTHVYQRLYRLERKAWWRKAKLRKVVFLCLVLRRSFDPAGCGIVGCVNRSQNPFLLN